VRSVPIFLCLCVTFARAMSTHVASIRRRQCAPCAPAWRSSYPTLPRYQLMKCPGPYFYLCFFHSFSSSMPLARLSTASHARCIISLLSSKHTHTHLIIFLIFFAHTHHYFVRIFATHKIVGCYSIENFIFSFWNLLKGLFEW
jgi:hypothetical protein